MVKKLFRTARVGHVVRGVDVEFNVVRVGHHMHVEVVMLTGSLELEVTIAEHGREEAFGFYGDVLNAIDGEGCRFSRKEASLSNFIDALVCNNDGIEIEVGPAAPCEDPRDKKPHRANGESKVSEVTASKKGFDGGFYLRGEEKIGNDEKERCNKKNESRNNIAKVSEPMAMVDLKNGLGVGEGKE